MLALGGMRVGTDVYAGARASRATGHARGVLFLRWALADEEHDSR